MVTSPGVGGTRKCSSGIDGMDSHGHGGETVVARG